MHPVEVQLIETSAINAASILMSLGVIISYSISKRCYPAAMSRKTLLISALMALCDLITSCFNFVGSSPKLPGAACGVVGGFFFAVPMLASTFYACSVALNCLLVFVLRMEQRRWLNRLYIYAPPLAALAFGVGGLAGDVYGLDGYWSGQCWYKTEGVSPKMYLIRKMLTWTMPLIIIHILLIISSIIILTVLLRRRKDNDEPPVGSFVSAPLSEDVAASLARRAQVRRTLILRLLAWIFISIICVLPLVILDLLFYLSVPVSHSIAVTSSGLNSCFGLFNGLIYCLDPTIIAIFGLIRRGEFYKNARGERSVWQHSWDGVTCKATVEEHGLRRLDSVASDDTRDSHHFIGGLYNFWSDKRFHYDDTDGRGQTNRDPRILVLMQAPTDPNPFDALARDLYDL